MSLPKPSGEFEWVQESWGAALRCRPLADVARHCFSTRELHLEGVRADDPAGWAALAHALGVELDSSCGCARCIAPTCSRRDVKKQASSRTLTFGMARGGYRRHRRSVSRPQRESRRLRADPARRSPNRRGRGCSCRLEGHGRGCRDGSRPILDLAISHEGGGRHRGRRSEHRPVLLRSRPRAGGCTFRRTPTRRPGSRMARSRISICGVRRAISSTRAGVPPPQIHVCALCTFDHPALFHSYRRDGANAGRLVAAIRSGTGKRL